MSTAMPSRRSVLATGLTGGAALAASGFAAPSYGGEYNSQKPGNRVRLTVLGTTDLHGNVYNWDYFKNAEFDNAAHDDIGLAKAATLIKAMRKERRGEPILTLDAGDTIQGTPLAYYYAKIDPITEGATHPMANAMNLVRYDAAALGNHEFNYGLDTLRTFEEQLNFPLLGANAVDPATKRPAFKRTSSRPSGWAAAAPSASACSGSPTRASRSGTRPTSTVAWSSPGSSSRRRSSCRS